MSGQFEAAGVDRHGDEERQTQYLTGEKKGKKKKAALKHGEAFFLSGFELSYLV